MPVKGERMGHLHKAIVAAVLAIAFLSVSDAYACTYFFFKAKDGAVISGRTDEFYDETGSQLEIVPQG
jgi:penicillin V acylase-like amidase (Ntn superfamily)